MKLRALILSASIAVAGLSIASPTYANEPFIGQIEEFGFNFCPRGWARTDGQLLPIAQNSALFSLLGTIYGGDGRSTFALPDLRGRVSIHQGNGPGLSNRLIGQRSGTETETLTTQEIPPHTHRAGIRGVTDAPNTGDPKGATFTILQTDVFNNGANPVPANDPFRTSRWMNHDSIWVEPAPGGGQAHNNMQPYQVTTKCIALLGIYPSRN